MTTSPSNFTVKIEKTHPDAKIPTYGTKGAACFDFYSVDTAADLFPSCVLSTGLKFEVPQGHVMLIFSRSGHGFNHGIRLANSVGVVDSDYRGEVKVKLVSDDCFGKPFPIQAGDRIAQGMIIPFNQVEFVLGDLSETERGTGGFGSTGR